MLSGAEEALGRQEEECETSYHQKEKGRKKQKKKNRHGMDWDMGSSYMSQEKEKFSGWFKKNGKRINRKGKSFVLTL